MATKIPKISAHNGKPRKGEFDIFFSCLNRNFTDGIMDFCSHCDNFCF